MDPNVTVCFGLLLSPFCESRDDLGICAAP
jgi:hypothetical protein